MAGQGRESRLWTVTMHLVQRAPYVRPMWCEFDYDGKLMESDKMVKYEYAEVYKSASLYW